VEKRNHRVCPVECAGSLDNRLRRWLQNPRKILSPYIEKGMTVLDIGCGPGFFSVDMAHLVGESGRVIAVDLQEGMLAKLNKKIQGTELDERFTLQKCEEDQLGVSEQVDFILVFYMFHEVTHQDGFLDEIGSLLKPEGRVLIVEPPFHVSTSAFKEMIAKARKSGLQPVESPKIFLGKAVVLKRVNKALDSEGPDGDRSQSLTHDS
jgi:ubiquinone/menaquinone biosynthesis C-methylase UbiE